MVAVPHALKAALALALLHSTWQIAVLAVLAAVVLSLQSSSNAGARHATGMGFLLAMALAPLSTFANLLATQAQLGDGPAVVRGPLAMVPSVVASFAYAPADVAPLWLPWAWAIGVALMMVRVGGGWLLVGVLGRRPFDPLPAHWQARAEALRQALGIRRQVAVRLLREAGLPCSAHAWRPVIWLPLSMLTQLSPDQVEALIAHELAHVRRLDWIWNGLQCVVEALLFYHPGMWWLSRRVRQERENACDDLAVVACGDPIALAEALSGLERLRVPLALFALSAKGGVLMQRIKRLLFPDSTRRPRLGAPLALLAIACSGALFAAQAQRPSGTMPPAAPDTPHWWNTVGHATRVTDTVNGHRREYLQWDDFSGRPHESYTVDGRAAPIDAPVRAWLAVALKPPVPPTPPLPPAAPVPPPPPPVPALPPAMETTQAYQGAVAAVGQDARVAAALGTPVSAVKRACSLDVDSFDCTMMLSGPRGIARLEATARKTAGRWTYSRLQVMPEQGDGFDVARPR